VVEGFAAGAVVADIVGAPSAAEVVAAGGQLPDEVVQVIYHRRAPAGVWEGNPAGASSKGRN
jgi:hypothetical protein